MHACVVHSIHVQHVLVSHSRRHKHAHNIYWMYKTRSWNFIIPYNSSAILCTTKCCLTFHFNFILILITWNYFGINGMSIPIVPILCWVMLCITENLLQVTADVTMLLVWAWLWCRTPRRQRNTGKICSGKYR